MTHLYARNSYIKDPTKVPNRWYSRYFYFQLESTHFTLIDVRFTENISLIIRLPMPKETWLSNSAVLPGTEASGKI